MLLLTLFALIAGAATALSPCVLPVLPGVLAAGTTGGRRRPLGVVAGLTLSFTFATVALVYVIDALGLPDDITRTIAIVVLLSFGLILLIPPLGDRVEAFASGLVGAPRAQRGEGIWSGLLLGAGLGLVYAPCAGPILAGVITVSASQELTAAKLVDRPRLRGRDGGRSLRDHGRWQEADRPPGAGAGQGQPGDGRGDDRGRPDAGDRPRHPLRDLPRPRRPLGARQPDPRSRGELGDRRRPRRAAGHGPARRAAGGRPAGGGGQPTARPRAGARARRHRRVVQLASRSRSPGCGARSC